MPFLDNFLYVAMQHEYCCCAVTPDDTVGIPAYLWINPPHERGIQMTTLALPGRREMPRLRRLLGAVSDFLAGIRLARALAGYYNTLSRLSDADLARRGIAREDIPSLVVNAKYDV